MSLAPLPEPAPPLRVAIAGGGVGGLTTALALLKQGCDVTVYEKTAAFARFGGPIQFASNALSTLKAIDERLFTRVMDKFTFTGTRRCGIKDGLRSDGSFRQTPVVDPRYLWDKSTPSDWFVEFPLKACADFFNLPYTGVVDRPDLQEILLDECRAIKADFIKNGDGVVAYDDSHESGVQIILASGATADADVLVGADGIWSAVRAQMFGEGALREMAADGLSRQGCSYSGYTVFAGETVLPLADYYDVGYNVYLGPKRYFVKSDVGNGRVQWYAFCAMPPGNQRAADSWENDDTTDVKTGNTIIDEIKALHQGWSSEITQILDSTPASSVEQRDLYDRWPELGRSWAKGRVVLVGDAIHPMMPNLGQGGCQAIEDAMVLAQELQTLEKRSQVAGALERYRNRRLVRSAAVQGLSRFASDIIIRGFDTPAKVSFENGIKFENCNYAGIVTRMMQPILPVFFKVQFNFLYEGWRNEAALDLKSGVPLALLGGLILALGAGAVGDLAILLPLGIESLGATELVASISEAAANVLPAVDGVL
mmetsp:Transcript_12424/g.42978  ORF Transcript_12424/g.42978 Transcript_12424/m.42978 type:complete len:539 (-) Transcript_12424:77-1693(-)